MTDKPKLFLDSNASGAWPYLVRGSICLANSDNERDLCPSMAAGHDTKREGGSRKEAY